MHAVGNEGSNFDLTGCGEFSESVEDVQRYQAEAQKYETNEKTACLPEKPESPLTATGKILLDKRI